MTGPLTPDIFNDDAFSLTALTATINDLEHIPGRAGELAFQSAAEGVPTISVAVERQGESLSLIPTSPRGAPAPKETQDKRNLVGFDIPQIKLEDTILAHALQGVGVTGENEHGFRQETPQEAVTKQLTKMLRRHELTLEHHRLGAVRGMIRDADGSVLVDLYEAFGFLNSEGFAAPEEFNFDLDSNAPGFADALRIKCHDVTRWIKRHAKTALPASAAVWAFCGDGFFDALVGHPDIAETYDGTSAAADRLGGNFAFNVFEYGGIVWENYRGTDDNSTVAIATDEARLFLIGVPGLYAEYFAPADFMETVNTIGLPVYAKLAPPTRFNQYVELHTQQNPLPLCLRPQTLVKVNA
jgi:hypothetical protein